MQIEGMQNCIQATYGKKLEVGFKPFVLGYVYYDKMMQAYIFSECSMLLDAACY